MGFNYLNYARYLLAKLGAVDTVSKSVCEAKGKVSKLAVDMITYYNSISKVIYGSESVIDVTPVGDLNGFRAMAASSVAGILKTLNYYEPVIPVRTGTSQFSPLVRSTPITGLNARLDSVIEDQNRLQIDTGIVEGLMRSYMVSIAWVPYTGVVYSLIVVPLPDTSVRPWVIEKNFQYFNARPQSLGNTIRDTVIAVRNGDRDGTSSYVYVDLVCWNGDIRMSEFKCTAFGDSAFAYLGPVMLDSGDIIQLQTQPVRVSENVGLSPQTYIHNISTDFAEDQEHMSNKTTLSTLALKDTPTMGSAWTGAEVFTYTADTEYVMADTRAMNLMFLILNDILSEINFA